MWGPENENADEMLEHVAVGVAVCIGSASMSEYYRHPDLVWLPITDIEPLRIALARSPDAATPLVGNFVRVVRELVPARPGGHS